MLDVTAILLTVLLVALVFAGRYGPPRVLLALAFAFFVPGRAIVSNWSRMGLWSEAGMSLVLSLAVLVLLTTVMLWIHAWHPLGLFQAVAALSLIGLIIGMTRRHRRTRGLGSGHHTEPRRSDRVPALSQFCAYAVARLRRTPANQPDYVGSSGSQH